MGTPIGSKRTEPRKPMKRIPIRKQSKRSKEEFTIWRDIKLEREKLLRSKFDYLPCEYCQVAIRNGVFHGHHNNHNRRENTLENCRLLHPFCHTYVEDNNIKDVPSLLDKW